MSNVHRVQNIFIGDGSALPTAGAQINSTNVANGDLAIAGRDMKEVTAGQTVADTDALWVVEGRTSGKLKRSMAIESRNITSYLGASYKPATRDVWSIGYNRSTSTGSIDVTNDADYQFFVRLKDEKHLYSERILRRTLTFHSDLTASQLLIANQITALINADPVLKLNMVAVTVGDGTGVYGLTAASNYGVEVTSLLQTQNVTYLQEDRVYFDIELDSIYTAFGTTNVGEIQTVSYGKGTYPQVSLAEKRNISYEGVLNFTKFPIPVQTYSASSTLVTSANVTATTGNIASTISEDVFTVTSNTILRAGEIIDINGTEYEIKYLIGTTKAVVTTPFAASYSGANLKVKYGYDSIVIEFSNPNTLEGAGVKQDSKQSVAICTPAIDSGGAYNSLSTQGTGLLAFLNPYMASLGFANVTL